MDRRTTVRDIAKRAGVHFTTVSRALSKHPSIPVTTCERIRKIAEELHYVPDPMLSALTAYRTRLAAPTFHGNIAWITNSFTREGWNTCPTFDLYCKGAKARAAELGYKLEEIGHQDPELIAKAGEGDPGALHEYDQHRLAAPRGAADPRPSMGQDMAKGRRTEIEYLNGFVVREGEKAGIAARANERLVDIVTKVERGELEPDPRHITELKLN